MALGFIKPENRQEKGLQIPCDFRHAIILGETGSGKTASVITPLIFDRMKKNHGLVIFDFKGNYHYTVKVLAKKLNKLDKVIEIGTDYGKSINLIEGLQIETIDKILRPLLGHKSEDKFWQESAVQLGTSILGIIKYMNELFEDYKPFNFKTLIEIVSNAKNIKSFKEDVLSRINDNISKFKDNSKETYLVYVILNFYQRLDTVADNFSLNKITLDDEKTPLNSVIASLINPISNLRKESVNIPEINILDELNQGKILIISLKNFEENLLNVIVSSIFSQIYLYKMDYPDSAITIVLDEAQKVLNNDFELPLDVLREYKVEAILATQSIKNLQEKLYPHKVDALLANLVHKVYLNGQDMNLPEFEAYYNNKYYKLNPVIISSKHKFIVEKEYQSKYTKLKTLPFKFKGKDVIYSKFSNTKLSVINESLTTIGKIDYYPTNFSKRDLANKFPDVLKLQNISQYVDLLNLDVEEKIF
jgi:type IV secretory pathway TraG/TraD family ATPase VirD4